MKNKEIKLISIVFVDDDTASTPQCFL